MSRTSQYTISNQHNPVVQQHFREFQHQYPQASSRQAIESGVLPIYPEEYEAYRRCREWEEAYDLHGGFQHETSSAEILGDDDSELTPTDVLTLLTLPSLVPIHGRWQQTPAYHCYEDTPRDHELRQSFCNACDALLPVLSPRDHAILALYADGHGPRAIRELLALKLTEQRIGQIIDAIRSKATRIRHSQQRADHHRRAQ
jgi:hypothetical protein